MMKECSISKLIAVQADYGDKYDHNRPTSIVLVNKATGKILRRFKDSVPYAFCCIQLSAERVAIGGRNVTNIFNFRTGALIATIMQRGDVRFLLKLNSNTVLAITDSAYKPFYYFDTKENKYENADVFTNAVNGVVTAAQVLSDSLLLIRTHSTLYLCNFATREVKILVNHMISDPELFISVNYDHIVLQLDKDIFATIGNTDALIIINVKTGEVSKKFYQQRNYHISQLHLLPNQNILAVRKFRPIHSPQKSDIVEVETQTGKILKQIPFNRGMSPQPIVFTQLNGQRLIAVNNFNGGKNSEIETFDLDTQQKVKSSSYSYRPFQDPYLLVDVKQVSLAARVVAQCARDTTSIFSALPPEIGVRIAAMTCIKLDERESYEIAFAHYAKPGSPSA